MGQVETARAGEALFLARAECTLWPESVIAEQPLQGRIDCIAVSLLTRVGTASWPAPDRSWRQCPFGFHRENSRAHHAERFDLCQIFYVFVSTRTGME